MGWEWEWEWEWEKKQGKGGKMCRFWHIQRQPTVTILNLEPSVLCFLCSMIPSTTGS